MKLNKIYAPLFFAAMAASAAGCNCSKLEDLLGRKEPVPEPAPLTAPADAGVIAPAIPPVIPNPGDSLVFPCEKVELNEGLYLANVNDGNPSFYAVAKEKSGISCGYVSNVNPPHGYLIVPIIVIDEGCDNIADFLAPADCPDKTYDRLYMIAAGHASQMDTLLKYGQSFVCKKNQLSSTLDNGLVPSPGGSRQKQPDYL